MNSFEILVDPDLELVKIIASGELLQADGEKIITLAREAAAKYSYNVLYDIRGATTTVAFSSWFHLPRELSVFQSLPTRRVKAAVLCSPNDKAVEDYKFYQTVMENLGISLRVFFDETEAADWLRIKRKKREITFSRFFRFILSID